MAKPPALFSPEKTEDNLANNERRENLNLVRRGEQPGQSDNGVKHIGVNRANVHRLHASVASLGFDAGFHHDRGDQSSVKI